MDDPADIVRLHASLVWKTVYRLVAHDADAADCFQETFIAALEMGRRARIASWQAMLKRIATSKALDLLRRRQRERRRGAEPAAWELLPGAQNPPGQAAENRELGAQLTSALAALPPAQAEAFCLRHLSDMSYEQIATEMGIKANAVGVMLLRAKAKLARLLANDENVMRSEVNHGK